MENELDETLKKYFNKSDLYFKVGIIKLFREKFNNDLVITSTKKYRIRNNINKEERSFLCIFYQNDETIGIKCGIFVDKKNSEFNIIFEKYTNNGEDILDFNCSSLDVNIIEQIMCIGDNFKNKNDKDKHETNIPKINLSAIRNIFTSKVIISLYTKLNQLYALYYDKPFTFIGYDKSACYLSLFAYLYYKNHPERIGNVVSFGMPRFGNLKFKETYGGLKNMKHLNIINKRDNICAHPIFDYHHIGLVVFFEDNDTIKTVKSYSDIQYLWRISIFYCNSERDHLLENYLRSIVTNKNIIYTERQATSIDNINDPYIELDGDYKN